MNMFNDITGQFKIINKIYNDNGELSHIIESSHKNKVLNVSRLWVRDLLYYMISKEENNSAYFKSPTTKESIYLILSSGLLPSNSTITDEANLKYPRETDGLQKFITPEVYISMSSSEEGSWNGLSTTNLDNKQNTGSRKEQYPIFPSRLAPWPGYDSALVATYSSDVLISALDVSGNNITFNTTSDNISQYFSITFKFTLPRTLDTSTSAGQSYICIGIGAKVRNDKTDDGSSRLDYVKENLLYNTTGLENIGVNSDIIPLTRAVIPVFVKSPNNEVVLEYTIQF